MLVFLRIRDMRAGARIAVLLRQTEVNDVYKVRRVLFRLRHDEVAGLDVAMDEVARVNVLDTRDLKRSDGENQHCSNTRGWVQERPNNAAHSGTPSAESHTDSSDRLSDVTTSTAGRPSHLFRHVHCSSRMKCQRCLHTPLESVAKGTLAPTPKRPRAVTETYTRGKFVLKTPATAKHQTSVASHAAV